MALMDLVKREKGQGMTEYIIILVLIAIVAIAIVTGFGGKIKGLWQTSNNALGNVENADMGP